LPDLDRQPLQWAHPQALATVVPVLHRLVAVLQAEPLCLISSCGFRWATWLPCGGWCRVCAVAHHRTVDARRRRS